MGSEEIAMGKKMDKEAAVENFKHTPVLVAAPQTYQYDMKVNSDTK